MNGLNPIEEVEQNWEVSVFPNPVGEELKIINYKLRGEQLAVLFDVSGRKILEQKIISSSTTIDLSAFVSGVYLLRLTGDNFSATKKIVKQ